MHFAAPPLSLSLLSYMVRVWVCMYVRVLPYRLADFTCRTTTLALACEIKLFVGSRRIKIKFLLFLPLLLLLLLTLLELLLLRPRAEASVTVTAAQPQSHHAPKLPRTGEGAATRVMKCRRAAVTWRLRSSSQPGFFGLHVARKGYGKGKGSEVVAGGLPNVSDQHFVAS